ncbi:MAG: hypothetical protein P1S60_17560 [Anaerolineae bacterium]|nr:hypothetical protein [Anaerolineae bacterium]
MRFATGGSAILTAEKTRIFYLALLGLIFTGINGILGLLFYRRERTAAYFLWSGLLIILIALWAAVIMMFLTIQ